MSESSTFQPSCKMPSMIRNFFAEIAWLYTAVVSICAQHLHVSLQEVQSEPLKAATLHVSMKPSPSPSRRLVHPNSKQKDILLVANLVVINIQSFGSHIRHYLLVQANNKVILDSTLDKGLRQLLLLFGLLKKAMILQANLACPTKSNIAQERFFNRQSAELARGWQ